MDIAHDETGFYKSTQQGNLFLCFLGILASAAGEQHCIAMDGGVVALFKACISGDEYLCREWLAGGGDPNQLSEELRTPLAWAADCGHAGIVKLLLEAGADAAVGDERAELPLHRAALNGHAACCEALLEWNSGLADAVSDRDMLPLHCAAMDQNALVARLLCSRTSRINSRDGDGFTALHHAASNGAAGVVAALCDDRRLKVDKGDREEGNTALMQAALAGHVEVVRRLLARGADVEARNLSGFAARDYAETTGVVQLLSATQLRVHCDCTQPGETVVMMWRDWTLEDAVWLSTSSAIYPQWTGHCNVEGMAEECKLAIVAADGVTVRWESGDNWLGSAEERTWHCVFRVA